MSKFNLSRFNLTRFNVSGRRQYADSLFDAQEALIGVMGDRADLYRVFDTREHLQNTTELILFSFRNFSPVETISMHTEMVLYLNGLGVIQEDLLSEVHASKTMNVEMNPGEKLLANIHAGKIIHKTFDGLERLTANIHVGKRMNVLLNANEMLLAETAAAIARYQTAFINVTIPAGQEIRINSDVFTASLNTQNIIHLYSGDWINFSRDTMQIEVRFATGGSVAGSVIYQDRFL